MLQGAFKIQLRIWQIALWVFVYLECSMDVLRIDKICQKIRWRLQIGPEPQRLPDKTTKKIRFSDSQSFHSKDFFNDISDIERDQNSFQGGRQNPPDNLEITDINDHMLWPWPIPTNPSIFSENCPEKNIWHLQLWFRFAAKVQKKQKDVEYNHGHNLCVENA